MNLFTGNTDFVDKIALIISYLIRFSLAAAIAISIINERWSLMFASAVILGLTFLPSIIEKNYKIELPTEFELVIVLFIYASLFLGEIKDYYTLLWWWDIVLHTGSGLGLGLAGFLIMYILDKKSMISASPIWIAVFSFSFGVAIGCVWEIFEFAMDNLFSMNMQKNGLVDTMWDLIVDSLGALVVSIVGYYYIKGKKPPLFNRMLDKFVKENPGIVKN